MCQNRILIVDDDELALAILELSIEYLLPDCQIIVVNDGAAALTELQRQPFDLILTDYNMPRMSGLDLTQAARQIFPNIPVILMTGCCGSEIQTRAVSVPLAGILTKPFTMSQLRDMLHQSGI